MASIPNIKRLSNEAKGLASKPEAAISALRDAIWQLCDLVADQQTEIEKLKKLLNPKGKL